ncbi:uncharacterized protein si:ch211-171b20.3 [Solea solea]|uniref:uncharacterized protein si:ch211-171b20.3 n=1 Tax=Solea solea TaxID=90069 RepID=UPI0027299FFC|nr:uncharacterized protein si:ch211-171b20.3 [Solea solea]
MMITYHVNSVPTTEALTAAVSSNSSGRKQRGLDAAGFSTYRHFMMGAGGRGQAAFTQNNHLRKKCPAIPPLNDCRDGKSVISSYLIERSPNLGKDDKLESENNDPEDTCGRHFLFDKKCAPLKGTRATVIPPLPRDYRVHRPGNHYPFSLSKELSHRHAEQPFTLGYPERYELNPDPAVLVPSTFFLNGRCNLSVEKYKLSRPKVNYPTCNLLTVQDNQKSQSYPDPVVGASRSFIHRISELSSLEADTVRQEKLRKRRQPRKPPS